MYNYIFMEDRSTEKIQNRPPPPQQQLFSKVSSPPHLSPSLLPAVNFLAGDKLTEQNDHCVNESNIGQHSLSLAMLNNENEALSLDEVVLSLTDCLLAMPLAIASVFGATVSSVGGGIAHIMQGFT